MATEAEQAQLIQAEIDKYDSIIESRKQQQQNAAKRSTHHHPYNQPNHHGHQPYANNRWATRGGFTPRGRGRGALAPQVYRNKTLIMNNTQQPKTPAAPNQTSTAEGEGAQSQPWVTRKDRHLQLINPAIYETQSRTRVKAMEETRKLKLMQKDEKERRKLAKYFQYPTSAPTNQTSHEITIQGVKFYVSSNGSKLIKVPGDVNAAKATPKTTLVAGVLFHRSKSGNMYRATVIRALGRRAIKKINEPCRVFNTTGSCAKGPSCRYIHDASKVAVCKDWLIRGQCLAGDSCDLSHDLTPERTPPCVHFARGNCSKATCSYPHVHVAANAPVCRAFAIYGYCEKGLTCAERHVNECPDFSNTGKCNVKGCRLPHMHKANVIRKNQGVVDDDGSSDISSDDDDDEIDSDDVDSDDMGEEFFGGSEISENDSIARQENFVRF